MKERLVLFMIVFGLGVFIYIFQSYFNTLWGLLFLVTAMAIYAIFTTLAYKLKKRQLEKHPKIIKTIGFWPNFLKIVFNFGEF